MNDRIVYVADALPSCDQWVPMIWVQLDDLPSPLGQFGVFYDSRLRRFTVHRENGSSSYSIPRAPGEDGTVYAWMAEPPVPPPDKSPAPFHYVTEKLPREGEAIGSFWVRFKSGCEPSRCCRGYWYAPHQIFVSLDGRVPQPFGISGEDGAEAWAYAWEPEPAAPPLPEDGR